MLSRVADSLYWLGRYSERTETNAHILDVQIENMLEIGRNDERYEQQWKIVLQICGYFDEYSIQYDGYYLKQMLHYLIADESNYNSILALVESIRFNAKNTRDCIPNELWEVWNSLYLDIKADPLNENYPILATTAFLTTVRKTALTATGTIDSLMTRDESYQFVKIGKWLERSEKTALICLRLLENEDEISRESQATIALQLTNCFEEYSRRYRSRQPEDILNFIIRDPKCSRSVAYGINKIKKTILDVESDEIFPYTEGLFEALTDLQQLMDEDATLMTLEERREWVKQIQQLCTGIGPLIAQTYYLTPPILVD